ncbi:MAG: triose-phosphate isomerase [Litoreibacter sp.]|nr:triose-phosphate isomerase [Litoreibacter sp.]
MRRKFAAGNWKMNGLEADLEELTQLCALHPDPAVDLMIAPPAPLISSAVVHVGVHPLAIGGQDCHPEISGAHTGDISAVMLKDAGASHVILGHSERRADHGEGDALVRAKTQAAHRAGLTAIVCVGETLAQRDSGETLEVIGAQLQGSLPDLINAAKTVLAYEPVWAIGTGKIPTLKEIGQVHSFMRNTLSTRFGEETGDRLRLLYGGSVKPSNAADIFAVADVDGALVGGASLKAEDFTGIISALEEAAE